MDCNIKLKWVIYKFGWKPFYVQKTGWPPSFAFIIKLILANELTSITPEIIRKLKAGSH